MSKDRTKKAKRLKVEYHVQLPPHVGEVAVGIPPNKDAPPKIDSSAAREALADLVGYGKGDCSSGDETNYLIRELLVAEIRRSRNQYSQLKYYVENYLIVLDAEKELR